MKSAVNYVALNRAEGPSSECFAVVYYTGAVAPVLEGYFKKAALIPVKKGVENEVLSQFTKWGYSAPKEGGYDKCDFLVMWENGESYAGRFDMQEGGKEGGLNFWASLKSRIEFYALVRRPSHFKDAQWASFSKDQTEDGSAGEAKKMLDNCEMYC